MFKTMILAVAVLGAVRIAAPSASTPRIDSRGQAPSSSSAQPTSDVDSEFGTALAMIDDIQKILDDAIDGKTGPVTIDRGKIDEMRAELAQIRISLKGGVARTDR